MNPGKNNHERRFFHINLDPRFYTLCFIIRAPLVTNSVSLLIFLLFHKERCQIQHLDHIHTLSVGIFNWMTNRVTVCQQREASRKAKSVQDCYIYLYFWQYQYIRKPWLLFHGVWFKLLSQPILIMKQGFSWFLPICMSCKMFQAYIYFLLSYFLHKQDKMSSSKSTQTYYPGKQKWRIMKNIAFSIAVMNAWKPFWTAFFNYPLWSLWLE